MAYETTYNTPVDVSATVTTWNIDPWLYSCRVRVWGGGGGGEFVNDTLTSATPGGNGGESSVLGVISGAGQGGGQGGRSAGGAAGICGLTGVPNWGNLGVTISQTNGGAGKLNSGGTAGGGGGYLNSGGPGTTGIFNFTSSIQHQYDPNTTTHYFNFSSADIYAGYPGLEGFGCSDPSPYSKHYHIGFNIPFVDDYSIYNYSFSQQAAGGSTTGPFFTTGGSPPQRKNTLIHTRDYGWLSSLNYYTVNYIIGNWFAASSPPLYRLYTFWNDSTTYTTGSFVVYETLVYRARIANTNVPPEGNLLYWAPVVLTPGTLYRPSSPWGISSQSITRTRYSYFDVWHCRDTGSTFVASQSLSQLGRKEGAVGRGGGGGGFSEFELTRQNLIDAGYDLDPYESDGVTQRNGPLLDLIAGGGGSSSVAGGVGQPGRIQIAWYEIPQVYITCPVTSIISGQSTTISWTVQGDADSITWTSGNIANANLNSFVQVSPIQSTTYTAVASGIGGSSYNNESSFRLAVYQIPSIEDFQVPTSINYGTETLNIVYNAIYCDILAEIKVYHKFTFGPNAGTTSLQETIAINVDNVTSEYSNPASGVSGTIVKNIAWDTWGPSEIQFVFDIVGSGGSDTTTVTTTVNIDRTPDNVEIPESDDLFKDQEPVLSPDTEVISNMILVDDIDIPVEIKSDYPIEVNINNTGTWNKIREI